ncbi:eukaryotic translation initiation factor 3 subunit A [Cyclospora cayetanensis]|uniref:Eukaryotic translation initiation factor 3 subunit A n=1 Tax=Cyclospora cayetanensis TaxID=88456 RepID=A0A6P6RT86_9EIME|nr:eukaryotic translation initiation factor 3 subunit A [Cyclospora cayetanensis]
MQTFQKPENALKRANELLSIGQQDAALRILHTAIGHRRFRSQGWDAVQEAIMLRHVQLCVDEGKLRLARDGLHQYRIVSQHANTQSLGKVVGELRARAEARLAAAKAKAGDEEPNVPEDLDIEAETPENLLLSTLQVEIRSAEARDVHQALRAEWDVYKIILDLLRTTPKLEKVYHDTARRAFQFCKENKRQQEFRRLCDMLRSHFALMLKNRNKEDHELLLRPELHLETRMHQLAVAADLELWRECSSTAEDVYNLGLHELFHRSLRSPVDLFHKSREKLLRWMALFYEKLSKVFWVGENFLFHALAWIRFFLHVKGFKKNTSLEDQQAMADVAVLAVLAIPTEHTDKKQQDLAGDASLISLPNYEQKKRLALLLGHSSVPTRESLIAALQSKDIMAHASSTCQELFSLLEAEFTPLKLCSLCEPLLRRLEEQPLLQPYVAPLKRVVFSQLTQQLSKVYVSLSIDYFTSHICTEGFLSWAEAEKLLVALVHSSRRAVAAGEGSGSAAAAAAAAVESGGFSVRIDYAAKALIFGGTDVCPERHVQNSLVSLSKCLDAAVQRLQPDETVEHQQERLAYQEAMGRRLQAEATRMNERLRRTNLRRLEKQEEQQKLEEERRRREAEQRRVEEKQERDRREEACKRRVERRQHEERIKARSETAALMLSEIRKIGGKDSKILIKGKHLTDINIEDVLEGYVDYDDLERAQRLQLDKERLLRVRQRRLNFKRVCHFIRACREEELPLLDEWAKKQLETDKQILTQLQYKHEEEHRAAFAAALEEKTAFEGIQEDKRLWVARQLQQRREGFAAAAAEQRQRLIRMLQIQKIQRARERREEAIRKQRQLEEQRRIEEEQRRFLEERERQRAEEEAKEKRLLEIAERQRQRDLEIEAKHGLANRESTGRRNDAQTVSRKSDSPVSGLSAQSTPPSPCRDAGQPQQQQQQPQQQQQQQQLEWRRSTPLPTTERERESSFKIRDEPFIRRGEKAPMAATTAGGNEALNWRNMNRDTQKQQQPPQSFPVRQPRPEQQQQQAEIPQSEEDGFTRVRRRK